MYKLHAFYTDDGSVGLYSPKDNDIYHSIYGALSEAYEKFIIPSNLDYIFKNNSEIKVLDICFGIGYNTKSFLNEYIKFYCNEAIYTDNIYKYNDKIYTNNILPKVFIHAIDYDKNLLYLSPFFISDKKSVKNNEIDFDKSKLIKNLSNKFICKYRLNKIVNLLLLEKLKNGVDCDIESILYDKYYSAYFDADLKRYFKALKILDDKFIAFKTLIAFLHNIYYRYISKSYKKAFNALKLLDFNFKVSIDDARSAIKNDSYKYNLVFLDAFSHEKCPSLWTYDFFKLLYEHLDDTGLILTYSNSARVRNAFLNAGFFLGKNLVNGKSSGTIACKNKMLIKNELSEFDLGLLKTKAGIFYRDENLNASEEAIKELHDSTLKNSPLYSSTQYIKNYNS